MIVQDQQGKQLSNGQMMNNMDCVKKFLASFPDQEIHAVVDVTRNWTHMYDWLEEGCDDVMLENPLKVKTMAEIKIKTDEIELAHLLRTDLMPAVYVPGKFATELRAVSRQRVYFVSMRTMSKNHINTIFDLCLEAVKKLKPQTALFGETGRKQLKQIKLSEIDWILGCDFIDDLNKYVKAVKETIKNLVNTNADVKRLISIPGIGQFTAWLLVAALDDIERFKNAKKLAAYAGLVFSTYSFGTKTFYGRIIKGCNKYIRWGMVEAINRR